MDEIDASQVGVKRVPKQGSPTSANGYIFGLTSVFEMLFFGRFCWGKVVVQRWTKCHTYEYFLNKSVKVAVFIQRSALPLAPLLLIKSNDF